MGSLKVRYLERRTYKGTTYFYWKPKKHYFVGRKWMKCPFGLHTLPDNEVAAHTEADRLNKALDAWRTGAVAEIVSPEGSFDWMICEYKKSPAFKALGERTGKEYGYILEAIRVALRKKGLAATQAADIDPQMAYMLHDYFAGTPRKAQLVVAISRIVYGFGRRKGILTENPFKGLGIKRSKPRQQIWLDIDRPEDMLHRIISLKKAAIEMGLDSMNFAIDLGLFTIQRENDILALAWSRYSGTAITLRQSKVRKWVFIPMRLPVFKDILDTQVRISPLMLVSERTGRPYDKDHFGDVFREVREKAGIPQEFQFRDFRRTGIVLYGMSGAEPQEIAAISGHTIDEVMDILETYMPKNIIMAQNGMDKLNERYGSLLSTMKFQKPARPLLIGVQKT